jgi:hypothetical protein
MQHQRNFRRTLTATAVVLGNFISCTGYITLPDGSPAGSTDPSAASQTGATRGSPKRATGVTDRAAVGAGPSISVAWSGTVGTWCGPSDAQTLWVTLQPAARACDVASHKLYSSAAEDTSVHRSLELPCHQ